MDHIDREVLESRRRGMREALGPGGGELPVYVGLDGGGFPLHVGDLARWGDTVWRVHEDRITSTVHPEASIHLVTVGTMNLAKL